MVHLKMIFRSWWRSKLNTTISIVSLTIGLVCSVVLTVFALEEFKIPYRLGECDNLFLVESVNSFYAEKNVKSTSTNSNTGMSIAQQFPEVESWVTVNDMTYRLKFKDIKSRRGMDRGVWGVTPSFCDVVDLPVVEGDLRRTINSANEIAVTNDFVRRTFGREAVLGDVLEAKTGGEWINGGQVPEQTRTFTITTILDEDMKLPLKYGALVQTSVKSLQDMGNATINRHYSFVKLSRNVSTEEFLAKFAKDTVVNNKSENYSLIPFVSYYFNSDNRSETSQSFFVQRDKTLLIVAFSISLAVLLIAIFNYINITMTRAKSRLKNIAGQIIFGASKWGVRMQTVLDTAIMVSISLGLALIIINSILPHFNSFMDCDITFGTIFKGVNWLIILLLCLVVVAFSSFYILTKIEVRSPMETFKNPLGRRSTVSQVMIVLQFAVSVVLIIFGMNISRQIYFIVNSRPDAEHILSIRVDRVVPQDYVDAVNSAAFVRAWSPYSPTPTMSISNNGVSINGIDGDEKFIEFYDMEFVEGRNFVAGEEGVAVVNETFLKNMDIKEPLGHEFEFNGEKSRIVGVVRDFFYDDTRKSIQSLVMKYTKRDKYYGLYVKVLGDPDARALELKELWAKSYPLEEGNIEIKSMAQLYRNMHPQEQRLMTIVNIFMVISLVLTALGLFGLAFYTVGQRSREIALRRIHGSTIASVILRLCRTFALWVGIAFVLAVPLAYYLSSEWLSGFVYRVPIVWWVFVATALISAGVTFFTVIFQTWIAANANPAEAVKAE